MPIDTAHALVQISNTAVGVGMLSMALAIGVGICKKAASKYRNLSLALSLLFLAAGISRIFLAFHAAVYDQLAADLFAGFFAVAAGFIIWPILRKTLLLPSYEEIEETNSHLAQANEKLHQQQQLFDAFMENNPAIAFLEDGQGRFVYVNRAFEKEIGVQREEVIGKESSLWASSEQAAQIRQHAREVLEKNQAITRISHFPKSPGSQPEPWLMVKFPIPQFSNMAVIGAMGLNVLSEFETQALHSKLASIVESTQAAIIGKDLDGNITSWNAGAEELYGYSAAEVLGKSMSILISPENSNELSAWLEKVRRGMRIQDYEAIRVCKGGEIKIVSESISPSRDVDGQVVGAAVVARDITVVKLQQDKIRELNELLKNRVTELAEANAALQVARDQALEASNLKSAFVANISHEVRTPLSIIIGANAILMQSSHLQDGDLDMAQMIKDSAEALLTIVNDILDLSKIEAGKLTLESAPFDPALLLRDCIRLLGPAARQKGLSYELLAVPEIPDGVYGDISRLRQILLNIIGNAIKFTDVGQVEVSAQAVELSATKAVIEFSVKDTGIGMSEADKRFLFMPFAQADNSSTRKFGGSGLGLTICKRFVDMMHGELLVQSEKGVGSTFTLRIPFERKMEIEMLEFGPDEPVEALAQPIPEQAQHAHRVLVVEDNAVLRYLALRQLDSLGIPAESTALGRDAVEQAMSDHFDMILMDINLPDISGLEATAAIREREHSSNRPEIPIIAMTAGAMKGDRERALAAGMNDYLAKPVAIEKLHSALDLWFSSDRSGRRSLEQNKPH